MSGLSLRARALLVLLVLVGATAYLAVVDMGVNAGRIHRGVKVGDVDVGGLTETEARRRLAEVGAQMENTPVVFTAEGLNFHFLPGDFGWHPLAGWAASRARDVGRTGGVLEAARVRAKAWTRGVKIRWPAKLNHKRIGTRLKGLERRAAALGYELDRPEMRFRIKQAIWSWPREAFYEIPVARRD